MRRAGGVLLLLALAACATAPLPPKANRLQPGHAPTPFSASEIRAACPDGTWVRFRIEVPGAPEAFLVFRFLNGGADGVTVVASTFDALDAMVGEPSAKRQLWTELQSHASFPRERVHLSAGTVDSFRGRLEGWLYTVGETLDGMDLRTDYYFARSLPGPPVLLEEFKDGTLSRRMTMVGRGKD
jgi:hypothetical protein